MFFVPYGHRYAQHGMVLEHCCIGCSGSKAGRMHRYAQHIARHIASRHIHVVETIERHGAQETSNIVSLFVLHDPVVFFPSQERLLSARVSVRHDSRRSDTSSSQPRRFVLPGCVYNLHPVAFIPSATGPHFARKGEASSPLVFLLDTFEALHSEIVCILPSILDGGFTACMCCMKPEVSLRPNY